MSGVSALLKETPESFRSLFPPCEDPRSSVSVQHKSGFSPEPDHAGTLTLDFSL